MCCPLVFKFSVGKGGFVIGLGQISFFFSLKQRRISTMKQCHIPTLVRFNKIECLLNHLVSTLFQLVYIHVDI